MNKYNNFIYLIDSRIFPSRFKDTFMDIEGIRNYIMATHLVNAKAMKKLQKGQP